MSCTWTSSTGEPCLFPGTISDGLKGDGRWKCCYHARCDTRAEGDAIVARSVAWSRLPNRVEAWHEARKREVYGAGLPPALAAIRDQVAQRMAAKARRQALQSTRQPGEDEEAA